MTQARARRGPGRPRREEADGQQRLLDAAVMLFAAQGFDAVGLRAIAAQADCDVSMVAHHFGSKAALWRAVVDSMLPQLHINLAQVDAICQARGEPLQRRVVRAIGLLFDHITASEAMARFVMRETSEPGERLDYLVEHIIRPVMQHYTPLWQEAVQAGLFPPLSPPLLHTGLVGAVAFLLGSQAMLAQLSDPPPDAAALRDAFCQSLFTHFARRAVEPHMPR